MSTLGQTGTPARTGWRGLPPVYWTLWTGTLINRLGGFVVPFLALYLTRARGLSVAEAGAIVSLYGAGSVCAGPVGGVLADRLGRRATMLLGLFGGASAMLALGFERSFAGIAVNTLVLAFLADMYRPAVSAAVADLVPPEDRLRAYGLQYWAVNMGFSIAPVIAGLMARRSYLALFVADAATTFVYGIIVLVKVPETRPAAVPRRPESLGKPPGGLADVFRDGPFVAIVVLTFLIGLIYQQENVSMAIDMRSRGISESTFGMVIALNGLLIVLLQPSSAAWLGRFRRSRALAAAALITGLGFGVYAVGHTVVWYAIGVAVWTLGEIGGNPLGSALVADLSPTAMRGRYQGAYTMAWGFAMLAGPALGSLVMNRFGAPTLWVGCAGLGAVIAIGHLAIAPARRRRLGGRD